jgi:hypothetical protein
MADAQAPTLPAMWDRTATLTAVDNVAFDGERA